MKDTQSMVPEGNAGPQPKIPIQKIK